MPDFEDDHCNVTKKNQFPSKQILASHTIQIRSSQKQTDRICYICRNFAKMILLMHKLVKRMMRFTLKYHYLAQDDCYWSILKRSGSCRSILTKSIRKRSTHIRSLLFENENYKKCTPAYSIQLCNKTLKEKGMFEHEVTAHVRLNKHWHQSNIFLFSLLIMLIINKEKPSHKFLKVDSGREDTDAHDV
jgi:hypothetical protein